MKNLDREAIEKKIIEFYPNSCFAYNKQNGYTDGCCDEQFVQEAYDVFRYEALKWCGCGCVDESDIILLKFLKSRCSLKDEEDKWTIADENLEKYFGAKAVYDDPLLLCLAYSIDAAELTGHGISIFNAWLTDKGELCKYLLELLYPNFEGEEVPE